MFESWANVQLRELTRLTVTVPCLICIYLFLLFFVIHIQPETNAVIPAAVSMEVWFVDQWQEILVHGPHMACLDLKWLKLFTKDYT